MRERQPDLARGSDVVTVEIESIPSDALRAADSYAPLRPGTSALSLVSDRALRKRSGFRVVVFRALRFKWSLMWLRWRTRCRRFSQTVLSSGVKADTTGADSFAVEQRQMQPRSLISWDQGRWWSSKRFRLPQNFRYWSRAVPAVTSRCSRLHTITMWAEFCAGVSCPRRRGDSVSALRAGTRACAINCRAACSGRTLTVELFVNREGALLCKRAGGATAQYVSHHRARDVCQPV